MKSKVAKSKTQKKLKKKPKVATASERQTRRQTRKVKAAKLSPVKRKPRVRKQQKPIPETAEYSVKQEVIEEVKKTAQAEPEIVPQVEVVTPKIREKPPLLKELELQFPISVKDLSVKLQMKASQLIQELMRMNIFATINQSLSQQQATQICEKFGFKARLAPDKEEQILSTHFKKDDLGALRSRSPVVTLMGHVDHGKTSLLDVIRKTKIVDAEHGGITQHIGAYEVNLPKGKITFLDTPGHEAFTSMRSRGAHITDIVVLVVAADDGVMPQTIEAVDHARVAGVPIVVAINKIDKPQANIDRVKKQLDRLGLKPEDWQGQTIMVGVSAKTGEGVDSLLEMILLEAEMLELKANYNKPASGIVIESRHDKNRGPLTTLLVENGILRLNDILISGSALAKIKAMFNDRGQRIEEVIPAMPVGVLGFSSLPEVGEKFFVVPDEKEARELVALREAREKQQRLQTVKRISLEDLHSEIKQGKIKELKLIIKADVAGSLEAVSDSLGKLETSEVKFDIIHAAVGAINTSDVMLAKVSDALILGFHVQPDAPAKELIEKEGIETRTYNIIYELVQELKAALEGILEPKIKKVFLGRAQVRKVFSLSRAGSVAGCLVSKGKILRTATVSLVRNNDVIFEGGISSLKRFKDDVREVAEGFECGISLEGFKDYQEGDIIEAYEIQKISRKL